MASAPEMRPDRASGSMAVLTGRERSGQDPRIWLLIGDKLGDNAQAEIIAGQLGWPLDRKVLRFKAPYAESRPWFRPTLHHIDAAQSSVLEPPWPDLVITIGRRPAMAAMWLRRESKGRTKIVLIGRPRLRIKDFDLIVAPPQFRISAGEKVVPLALPLMRPDLERIAEAGTFWTPRFAELARPLTAVLVGGKTHPFRYDAEAARDLVDQVRRATARQDGAADQGGPAGSLYFTTSRRTPAEAVSALEAALPSNARLHAWRPEGQDNPYLGLLALADRFVVTGDSISMMVEVARQRKPLALYAPPVRMAALAALARGLGLASDAAAAPDVPANVTAAAALNRLLFSSRDLTAVQRALVDRGLAVWLGQPFLPAGDRAPDDLEQVVRRIRGLF